ELPRCVALATAADMTSRLFVVSRSVFMPILDYSVYSKDLRLVHKPDLSVLHSSLKRVRSERGYGWQGRVCHRRRPWNRAIVPNRAVSRRFSRRHNRPYGGRAGRNGIDVRQPDIDHSGRPDVSGG